MKVENLREAATDGSSEAAITLSTGPFSAITHWKMSLFLWDEPLLWQPGTKLHAIFMMERNQEYPRHYHIAFSVEEAEASTVNSKLWKLWR
jgi:hypothetical protein